MEGNLTLNSSSVGVCTVFETHPYVIVAAVSSGSAMVSALCCIFVIGLIFFLKKQVFFIQRIILYHCLATLLRSLSTMLRLNRLGYRVQSTALDGLCVLSGLTNQITLWMLLLDYSVITFTLLMTTVFRKNVARLEGLFIVLIFVVPLTFNWIPLINNSYGLADPWCWIRIINFDDCSRHSLGVVFRYVLWDVPFFIQAVLLGITYLFTVVYISRWKCCRPKEKIDLDSDDRLRRKLRNEAWWPVLFLPPGVFLSNFFPLVRALYDYANPGNPSYVIWILNTIFSPLQGGYVALVYVLDSGTLKRLSFRNCKAAITRRATVSEYPAVASTVSDSVAVGERSDLDNYRLFMDNRHS